LRYKRATCPEGAEAKDEDWKEEDKPWVIGRRPFGKIAIANSDADASACADLAIDQA
jgi:spermidine dehydrogenase